MCQGGLRCLRGRRSISREARYKSTASLVVTHRLPIFLALSRPIRMYVLRECFDSPQYSLASSSVISSPVVSGSTGICLLLWLVVMPPCVFPGRAGGSCNRVSVRSWYDRRAGSSIGYYRCTPSAARLRRVFWVWGCYGPSTASLIASARSVRDRAAAYSPIAWSNTARLLRGNAKTPSTTCCSVARCSHARFPQAHPL